MRETLGSDDAAGILPTTLFATTCSTVGAILTCKLLERFGRAARRRRIDASTSGEAREGYPLWSRPSRSRAARRHPAPVVYGREVGPWIVPLLVVGFLELGVWKGVTVYETFVEGAKRGLRHRRAHHPVPGGDPRRVGMLRGSGAIEAVTRLDRARSRLAACRLRRCRWCCCGRSPGRARRADARDDAEHGPDSYSATWWHDQGSSETTFYVLAVYFGAVGVKRSPRDGGRPAGRRVRRDRLGDRCQTYFTYNGLW